MKEVKQRSEKGLLRIINIKGWSDNCRSSDLRNIKGSQPKSGDQTGQRTIGSLGTIGMSNGNDTTTRTPPPGHHHQDTTTGTPPPGHHHRDTTTWTDTHTLRATSLSCDTNLVTNGTRLASHTKRSWHSTIRTLDTTWIFDVTQRVAWFLCNTQYPRDT